MQGGSVTIESTELGVALFNTSSESPHIIFIFILIVFYLTQLFLINFISFLFLHIINPSESWDSDFF